VRAPSDRGLLEAWERGAGASPPRRALTLLECACDRPWGELAALSVGRRDALLVRLRELLFGPHIEAVATCERCQAALEIAVSTEGLRTGEGGDAAYAGALSVDGWALSFRLPTSLDLFALGGVTDVEAGRRALVARCTWDVTDPDGAAASSSELPAAIVDALAARMGEIDAQAVVTLAMRCPECAATMAPRFDVASFLWSEVDAWARALAMDVHVLASSYGWSEAEILALGSRRARYLELILG